MSEVIVRLPQTITDAIQVPCGYKNDCKGCGAIHRIPGLSHFSLTFKPGKRALWRERT